MSDMLRQVCHCPICSWAGDAGVLYCTSLFLLAHLISDHAEFMKGRYAGLSHPCQMLLFIAHQERSDSRNPHRKILQVRATLRKSLTSLLNKIQDYISRD